MQEVKTEGLPRRARPRRSFGTVVSKGCGPSDPGAKDSLSLDAAAAAVTIAGARAGA